ncbi:MAG: glycosyltransferase family 4 protein [Candidatus Sumerlaeia bacterium]
MSKKPKVTIVCQLFYPELVSTGQTLTEIAEELTNIGVEVDVVCGPPTVVGQYKVDKHIEHKGIHIHRVWGTQYPKIPTRGKLVNLVTFTMSAMVKMLFMRGKTPFIILTNPPFLAASGVLCRWLRRRPYIFLVFDIYPDIAAETHVLKKGGFAHRAWNVLNRVLYRNASKIIVLGDRMADRVRSRTKLGPKHDDRIEVIHIWADDRNVIPMERSESAILKEWGLEDKFLVQYSGNMGRMHDMETFLKAANHLKSDYPDIHFQFIGEGYKKAFMLDYVKKHDLTNCSFHPYVERERLPESLAAASAGCVTLDRPFTGMAVPSKMFGILATGRPVIGVMEKNSEAGELVIQHDCGVIVEPGDDENLARAIRDLSRDPERCRAMGERGAKALREHYSVHQAAQEYKRVIESLQP